MLHNGRRERGDALLTWYRETLDGTAVRRRGLENTKAERRDYLDYWRHQHALGQPVPRDLEDEIVRGG